MTEIASSPGEPDEKTNRHYEKRFGIRRLLDGLGQWPVPSANTPPPAFLFPKPTMSKSCLKSELPSDLSAAVRFPLKPSGVGRAVSSEPPWPSQSLFAETFQWLASPVRSGVLLLSGARSLAAEVVCLTREARFLLSPAARVNRSSAEDFQWLRLRISDRRSIIRRLSKPPMSSALTRGEGYLVARSSRVNRLLRGLSVVSLATNEGHKALRPARGVRR